MMHGFDWAKWTTGTAAERLGLIPPGQEHVLQQEDGKQRFIQAVTDAIAGLRPLRGRRRGNPHPRRHFLLPGRAGGIGQALGRADDAATTWTQPSGSSSPRRSSPRTQVIDVFTAAGLKKPDISHSLGRVPRRGARSEA